MNETCTVLVVGDGPVAGTIVAMVSAMGWSSVTATSHPDVTEALPGADAVVVLSHDEDLEGPAIRAALEAGPAYVGAMGSRRTQARRREWLEANGLGDGLLQRLHAPIGLDIGADDPGEIAVSILAEIIAVRRGAAAVVGSLSERGGAIHPGAEPGTATCPGG